MKDMYQNLIKRLAKFMFNEKADEIFNNKNMEYIENLICDKIYNFKEEYKLEMERSRIGD